MTASIDILSRNYNHIVPDAFSTCLFFSRWRTHQFYKTLSNSNLQNHGALHLQKIWQMENNIIGKSLSQHRLTEKTDINRRKQGIRRGRQGGREIGKEIGRERGRRLGGDWEEIGRWRIERFLLCLWNDLIATL